MARVLQIRRGTTAQNDNFTGMAGEITFDTDAKTLRVHDGTTLGGFALARADGTIGVPGDDDDNEFDINDVPAEFWQSLFQQYGTAPLVIKTTPELNIPASAGTEYVFSDVGDITPKFAQAILVCKVADAGYTPNDNVFAFGINNLGVIHPNIWVDDLGLHVKLPTGGNTFWVCHKSTGQSTNITKDKWRILFRVYC